MEFSTIRLDIPMPSGGEVYLFLGRDVVAWGPFWEQLYELLGAFWAPDVSAGYDADRMKSYFIRELTLEERRQVMALLRRVPDEERDRHTTLRKLLQWNDRDSSRVAVRIVFFEARSGN